MDIHPSMLQLLLASVQELSPASRSDSLLAIVVAAFFDVEMYSEVVFWLAQPKKSTIWSVEAPASAATVAADLLYEWKENLSGWSNPRCAAISLGTSVSLFLPMWLFTNPVGFPVEFH